MTLQAHPSLTSLLLPNTSSLPHFFRPRARNRALLHPQVNAAVRQEEGAFLNYVFQRASALKRAPAFIKVVHRLRFNLCSGL